MGLNAFAAKVAGQNVQRQNKYRISIMGPRGLGAMDQEMLAFAESVEIPGQTIISNPEDLRYGPTRELATAMSYGPTNITFICTPGMPERKYFTLWQALTINKMDWEAFYYADYAAQCTMSIFALDSDERDRYAVKLFEVFPKTVSGQAFGAASNDTYQTLDVEFAFRYWTEEPNYSIEKAAPKIKRHVPYLPPAYVGRNPPAPPNPDVLGEAESGGDDSVAAAVEAEQSAAWAARYMARQNKQ